ncbi:TPA: WecB/TagA/CpsF family glycosyltransferase [Vibrio vulnificus]|nr:WecB/TagA/CpsF family glycosyltransferase [Vibrio vulnificus]
MKCFNVFGLKYHTLSKTETLNYIFENLDAYSALVRSDLNVGTVVSAQEDTYIADYIYDSDLVNVDGMGVLFYLRLKGIKVERYTGVDLFLDILKRSQSERKKVYLFGAKADVLEKAELRIINQFGEVVSGKQHGYIDLSCDTECNKIVEDINCSGADFLFVGIKSPEKEIFIKKYRKKLNVSWIFGVGGAIDVVAGEVKRAPEWIQRIGFEWLYRVYQEPKRMWKRYLVSNTKFLFLILKSLFKQRAA